MSKPKAIVCLSGGLDSAVLMAMAMRAEREVQAVSFYYGSHHNPYELEAAQKLAELAGVPHSVMNIASAFTSFSSALLRGKGVVPDGHYNDENMKQTVVPGRNMIFCSILTGLAISLERNEIWMGMHAGDHHIYPDCRPDFIKAIGDSIRYASEGSVTLQVPMMNNAKDKVVAIGLDLKVPFEYTRTCYKPQRLPCGKCGSCTERLEAFARNNRTDPLEYAR